MLEKKGHYSRAFAFTVTATHAGLSVTVWVYLKKWHQSTALAFDHVGIQPSQPTVETRKGPLEQAFCIWFIPVPGNTVV
ncbi:hypothetical protein [Salidesulfovibrio brasiliensis]|uniref:hypothetical protein n=1 Tax=Salidesulfovibrio brasiliensis TaxID=221711 RepID=UPI0012EECA24|nr:hypothetical protein [Salidesulfovibrio brasiliensis]